MGRISWSLIFRESRYAGTLVSDMHHYNPGKTQEQLVQEALEHPVGTPRLCEMARGKKKVVIIASDHTRPVPSKVIAPLMLAEIRRGNPDADITFLISTGCHRETTKEELINKFGEEIVKNEKIYIHDCDDESMLVNLGKLPSGGDLIVNPDGGRGRPSGGGGLSSSRISSRASPAEERASCPASLRERRSSTTITPPLSTIPIPAPVLWRAIPSTSTCSTRRAPPISPSSATS